MRVVNLCRGAGNGVDTACLMTATAIINGEEPSDSPSCVCPVIRAFVVITNDFLSNEIRSEFYGPLPWELIGTRSTLDVMVARAGICASFAESAAEYAAESAEYAKSVAEYALSAAKSAEYAESAKSAAKSAALSAEYAESAAKSAALYAAESAEYAEYAYHERELAVAMVQCIRDMIALDPPPKEQACLTEEDMFARLGSIEV